MAPRRRDTIGIWDLGPPHPVEPAAPPLPAGFEQDPRFQYEREMVRFRHALNDYDQSYRDFLAARKDFAAFGGKPKHIAMAFTDAEEALARDPRRYQRSEPK